MSDIKIGAYICKGCGLGERLDCAQLETIASREGKAVVARQHDFLCSAEGVALIQADLDSDEVNRVVIAGCSRRAKVEAFSFNGTPVSRANLREGVIWVRPDDDDAEETTQEMADDYVQMACAEAKFMGTPVASEEQQLNKNILVVGGGISGLTAAAEIARAGYQVTIVEKSDRLGGQMGRLHKRIPTRAPYQQPQETGIDALLSEVADSSLISVFLNAALKRTSGAPGRFEVEIESGEKQSTESFGAIVQASGFNPYDANLLPEFAYGASPDVVTQAELEALAMAADGEAIKRPSDGKEVEHVVFVQCAGQRSDKPDHLDYCSGHCCSTSIKQALYFKDQNSDINTTVLYQDLRTPGAGGEDFYRAGQEAQVTFIKSAVSAVDAADGSLTVKFSDLILDEETSIAADLVVLATGMVPNSGVDIRADDDMLASEDEAENKVEKAADEAAEADSDDSRIELNVESVLNLDYRQGPDLPHLSNGFTDSHFICFPYETRRTGIYVAGPVRRPMDSLQAREDATGAAMKAIQAVENAGLGKASFPRAGDLSFPKARLEGCTQCKRCTVECPFGAIDEDENAYPLFNESRCRRCGTCMGACPVRVISFENYSVDTVGSQIKTLEIPDEFEEKPRILVLACENDAYPALDMGGISRVQYNAWTRVVPVRCLGSTNASWITDALNNGWDGVVMMGCKKGVDYQCHFVKGSELAHIRMSKIADTLKTMDLEEERVAIHEVAITDSRRAPELIEKMAAVVEEIGPSPFKF